MVPEISGVERFHDESIGSDESTQLQTKKGSPAKADLEKEAQNSTIKEVPEKESDIEDHHPESVNNSVSAHKFLVPQD